MQMRRENSGLFLPPHSFCCFDVKAAGPLRSLVMRDRLITQGLVTKLISRADHVTQQVSSDGRSSRGGEV